MENLRDSKGRDPHKEIERIDWCLENARLRIYKYVRNGDVRSLAIEQHVLDRLLVERMEAMRVIESETQPMPEEAKAPKKAKRSAFK